MLLCIGLSGIKHYLEQRINIQDYVEPDFPVKCKYIKREEIEMK